MSSYNKQKGTKFESDVMKYIRSLGHFAERLAKAGANDEGDIVTIIAGQTYILECKNRKAMNLPQFWAEAQTEAANYAKARGLSVEPPAFVIVKRRNASVEELHGYCKGDCGCQHKTGPGWFVSRNAKAPLMQTQSP